MGNNKRNKFEVCPNCEQPLETQWEYCPACGQSVYEVEGPLKYLVSEVSGNMYSFDSKLFRTIGKLFAKPGIVASEYVSGKMVRYVPPIRLYIFVSILFFLSLSLRSCVTESEKNTNIDLDATFKFHKTELTRDETSKILTYTKNQLDSFIVSSGAEAGYINRTVVVKTAKIAQNGIGSFVEELKANATLGMFLLMPLSAIILYVFYRKKRKFYFDHLIATVYLHTALFILLLVNEIIILIFNLDGFTWALVLFYIYFIWSLSNFYNSRWPRTLLRSFPIVFTYFVFLVLFVITVTFTSFITY